MMNNLEKKIGYTFSNPELLKTALTHSSYAYERKTVSYERLEFLGDSVLGFVSADFLYAHKPEIPEGKMTKIRSENVCTQGLSHAAETLSLGKYILVGHSEEHSGGRNRKHILEDVMESLIGAIYLDGGIHEARNFILNFILNDIQFEEGNHFNPKGKLQEILQEDKNAQITYEQLSATGPDHDPTFEYRVLYNGKELGRGMGKSKKEAECIAAEKALEKIHGQK